MAFYENTIIAKQDLAEKKLICKENKEFNKKSSSLRFLGI